MDYEKAIRDYENGPRLLRSTVTGLDEAALRAHPVPGKWSIQEVVCHLADFEPIYADRMKRVLAEDRPTLLSGDPDRFAARLAYDRRSVEDELLLIEMVRRQMARILRSLAADDFQREGLHSTSGPLTLATLLERITDHIPHHLRFIETKRRALGK